MISIYALVSGQLILYVGKTKNIKKREIEHRSNGNDCTSKDIPEYIDWEIKLLEEVPDDQGVTKEQHYYDTLKPLYNKCRPGQTQAEYRQSEAGKEINHRYQQTEAYKGYQRRYNQSEAYKEVQRRYNQSEAGREARRRYYLKKKSEKKQNGVA